MKKQLTFCLSITFGVFITLGVIPAEAKKWVVTVKNYSFFPYNLTHVRAHDTIQWVWESGSHTTTSTSIPAGADSWDYPINQDTTSFIYIPTDNGTFFYRSTPDTASVMNGQFTVTGGNAVDENRGKQGFNIFPNPFQTDVTIHIPGNHSVAGIVQIYDPEGKMVKSAILDLSAGSFSQTLDMTDLPRGTFIFRIGDGSGNLAVFKAIHD
jgi:plastocyanin